MKPYTANHIFSKDDQDRQDFAPQFTPWELPITSVSTTIIGGDEVKRHQATQIGEQDSVLRMNLDGTWQLAEEGADADRLHGEWHDAIAVQVPGSIHQALVAAGQLADPSFGTHAALAKEYSHRTWWHKYTFTLDDPEAWKRGRLIFDGVSPSCEVWLNGHKLGTHEGSFGGPEYEVAAQLQQQNTIIVKVHPAPLGNEWNVWHSAIVFNCNYGWHYVNLPAVGIWQSVRLEALPQQHVLHPFIAVHSVDDAHAGRVELTFELAEMPLAGDRVYGWIELEQGKGRITQAPSQHSNASRALFFEWQSSDANSLTSTDSGKYTVRLELTIPEPQLWWPLDMGEQALYRLTLACVRAAQATSSVAMQQTTSTLSRIETTFGIRHIEMQPFAEGIKSDEYKWTFAVNGVPVFAKGTGWCTLDALMDFRRERYAHFLGLAAEQHVNFMRAWGGGIPETDDFYDWCDRLGIMIMQEWPTCWGSHANQPRTALEETVRRNTLRLRNRPSLVMWCGGNETSSELDHEAMRMMGRLAIELDDTRPFHRTDPLGGSTHDHIVWNGWTPAYSFDYYAGLEDRLLSEFGLASAPTMESMQRYMPIEEQQIWPPPVGESFYAHLPAFDTRDEMRILSEFAGSFIPCDSLESFAIGTQLAQIVSLRHKMESARCHWPQQTGVVTYKLNDVYPGVSWSTIDWYGVPKPSHYFTADAYAPLAVYVLFKQLNSPEQAQHLPVYLVDEQGVCNGQAWKAHVRVYDASLQEMLHHTWEGASDGTTDDNEAPPTASQSRKLGELELQGYALEDSPVLIVSELYSGEGLAYRTFYWLNFDARPGVLFDLPRTELQWTPLTDAHSCANDHEHPDPVSEAESERYPYAVRVANRGDQPAVAVELYCTGSTPQNYALAKQQFYWLDAGEERIVQVRSLDDLQVRAWNAGASIGNHTNNPVTAHEPVIASKANAHPLHHQKEE